MSRTRNNAVRCDWCGRLSRHPLGEYLRPDGAAGYIHPPDWDKDGPDDVCEECASGVCPACGSEAVVNVAPAAPGPDGWGGRCKACGHEWRIVVAPAPENSR